MTMGKVGEYNPILEKKVIKKDPEQAPGSSYIWLSGKVT